MKSEKTIVIRVNVEHAEFLIYRFGPEIIQSVLDRIAQAASIYFEDDVHVHQMDQGGMLILASDGKQEAAAVSIGKLSHAVRTTLFPFQTVRISGVIYPASRRDVGAHGDEQKVQSIQRKRGSGILST